MQPVSRCGSVCVIIGAVVMATAATDDLPRDTVETEALWSIPLGLPEPSRWPGDTPGERLRVELGRRLFFDSILSRDHDRSCATCHQPEHGFASPDPQPAALDGGTLERNAPTLFNRAYGEHQMWDGQFQTLEQQALAPIEHEQEFGLSVEIALKRLRTDDHYPPAFAAAFGTNPDAESLAAAIASFVRRLTYGDTPFDRFHEHAKFSAMTSDERAGMWLFQSRAGCWQCHNGFNLTDEQFHNTGVGAIDDEPEAGRMAHTNDPKDAGRFKTPTLRALLETAPYFHDGSAATLRDVVEFYNEGGRANSNLDPKMSQLNLSEREIEMLVAFLGSLSHRADDSLLPPEEG